MKKKTIFYAGKIWECDGIGSYEYYIAKHFKNDKNIEIELWYKDCHPDQLEAFNTVAKCVQYVGQPIYCDNFIMSSHDIYDNNLLNNVHAKQVICCCHEVRPFHKGINSKITKYIAVSNQAMRAWETTVHTPCETFYPIVEVTKLKRTTPTNDGVLRLVSCGRFNDKGKCADMMVRLADKLKANNIKYEWNVYGIYDPQLTQDRFNFKGRTCQRDIMFQEIVNSDFLVQFTKAEGFGLSIAESLNLETPIITTPFSVLKEHNVNEDNCIIMEFDCSNIDDVVSKMTTKKFDFEYYPPTSNWSSLLNTPKVSIIIPAYNQEKLIKKCLDSIPERNDIEVLVVDDCSTDKTYDILKKYTRIPITIYHLTKNMGVGYARNIGLKYALGEYVYGVDSDDYVDTEMFNKVLDTLPTDYDIIRNWIKVNNDDIWGDQNWCCAMHTMFIKRSFIGDIEFSNKRYAEDLEFFKKLKAKQPKETRLDKSLCFYNYNYPREGSLDWIQNHENTSA